MGISENKDKLVRSQFYSEPWPVQAWGRGFGGVGEGEGEGEDRWGCTMRDLLPKIFSMDFIFKPSGSHRGFDRGAES